MFWCHHISAFAGTVNGWHTRMVSCVSWSPKEQCKNILFGNWCLLLIFAKGEKWFCSLIFCPTSIFWTWTVIYKKNIVMGLKWHSLIHLIVPISRGRISIIWFSSAIFAVSNKKRKIKCRWLYKKFWIISINYYFVNLILLL